MLTERGLREFERFRYMVAAKDVVPLLDAKDAEIARLQDIMRSALDELANGSEAEAYLILQNAVRSFPQAQEPEA